MRLVGSAFPVASPPGDNLWIHHALALAQPGEALVVNTGSGVDFGYWGEVMATSAMARGLAGLVITGGVRDTERLLALGLPTFSACISIRGTAKDLTRDGSVGEPIRIGDVSIRRGDLVVGDADGVVVIEAGRVDDVLTRAREREAEEASMMAQLRQGALTLDLLGLRHRKCT